MKKKLEIGIKAATDASRQMMKMLAGSENVNKLSEEAFLGWVHKGSQMPGDKRRGFAKGSEARRAMILLLRTVEIIARSVKCKKKQKRRERASRIYGKHCSCNYR